MNESKFTELVNLYFDQEISSVEIESLREELAVCPARKAEFASRYRLHQAICIAVAPEASRVAELRVLTAKKTSQASRLTLWLLGFGIAGCVSVAFVLFSPVIREASSVAPSEELAEVLQSDMKCFAATQGAGGSRRGSLASQLRLMGLTPALAPLKPQLSTVDVEALLQREASRQREIDRLSQYQAYSAMPEQRLFEPLPQAARVLQSPQLRPAVFQSSLARF
ncbi:MAG: hypothetical protein HOO08_03110 [Opitutae bacterium]|jgi:hypothetical protein|nr:hypothetical protein [Opitutae bacterium]